MQFTPMLSVAELVDRRGGRRWRRGGGARGHISFAFNSFWGHMIWDGQHWLMRLLHSDLWCPLLHGLLFGVHLRTWSSSCGAELGILRVRPACWETATPNGQFVRTAQCVKSRIQIGSESYRNWYLRIITADKLTHRTDQQCLGHKKPTMLINLLDFTEKCFFFVLNTSRMIFSSFR